LLQSRINTSSNFIAKHSLDIADDNKEMVNPEKHNTDKNQVDLELYQKIDREETEHARTTTSVIG